MTHDVISSCTYNRLYDTIKSGSTHIQFIHLKMSHTSKFIQRFFQNIPTHERYVIFYSSLGRKKISVKSLFHFQAKESRYSCCIPLLSPNWRPSIILPNISLYHHSFFSEYPNSWISLFTPLYHLELTCSLNKTQQHALFHSTLKPSIGISCCIPPLTHNWRPFIILPNVSLCHHCLTWKALDH